MENQTTTLINEPRRALGLDALRGFAILTMFLSGLVPFGVLPGWMYHVQVPPPLHKFVPTLPGISWVDLVFPFFLFSMGAAIPLSLSNRINKLPTYKVVLGIFWRGLLLAGFAIYDQHIRPYSLSKEPTDITWLTALLGFALLFPVLARLPENWDKRLRWGIRIGGLIGVILFLSLATYPSGPKGATGFSLYRSDIIILVLANVAVGGSLIWLLTRSNILLRIGFLGILAAIRLARVEPGWVKWLWDKPPLDWFLAPFFNTNYFDWLGTLYFQQYLFLIIPGTIIGEMLYKWMKTKSSEQIHERGWSNIRLIYITILMFEFILVMLIGLYTRLLIETLVITAIMSVVGWYLFSDAKNETEKLLADIFKWGLYLLILGLFFEPYEGGIKKDKATMSYYFVTGGLACFMLIAFTIIIDVFKKKRWLQLLIDNGQNPMIAYAGITNLIPPILGLLGLWAQPEFLKPYPWLGVIRAIIITLILGWMVSLFTKKKIFLRT